MLKQRLLFNLMIVVCFGSIQMSCTGKPAEKRLYEHVVVIGIDGLTSKGLIQATTPVMDHLIANGAYKKEARAILPSVSSPNWGAMIHGTGPEANGVTSNDPSKWMLPVEKSRNGRFPGIFDIIREQLPEAEQGAIFHWDGFGTLVPKDVVNRYESPSSAEETTEQFCKYITAQKPVFAFIQIDHVDGAGHHSGYTSDEYLQTVTNVDSLVGRIIESIRLAGMEDNTLVMVVSDHGGINTGHGGQTPEEVTVPVIYYGKGVKKNYKIQQVVYMYDVAANVAFALNLKTPYSWTGRPTLPAFEGYTEPE